MQNPTFYLCSFQSEAAEWRLQCLGHSQSTSKTDNGLACYLQLFSIRKQSNYGSLSRGSHAGPHEASGTLRMFEPAPRNLQCRPAKYSSSPWLGIGNSIRYSFNSQKSTFLPGRMSVSSDLAHCHPDCSTQEIAEQFFNIRSHGRRGCPTLKPLAIQGKGCGKVEPIRAQRKNCFAESFETCF